MHFAITSHDRPDSTAKRAEVRPRHLDYLRAAGDRLLVAGPILGGVDGASAIGSILIIEADDQAAAEAFAANDPYARAGLFASTTVVPWRKVFPEA